MSGISARHSAHQLAKKLTRTTLPRRDDRRRGLPSKVDALMPGDSLHTCSGSDAPGRRLLSRPAVVVPRPRMRRDTAIADTNRIARTTQLLPSLLFFCHAPLATSQLSVLPTSARFPRQWCPGTVTVTFCDEAPDFSRYPGACVRAVCLP